MKIDLKYVIVTILLALVSGIIGYMGAFKVQKYAIQEHERIKRAEKEVLKQKIKRENQVLIRRLEEDWKAFKDSVVEAFRKKQEKFILGRGIHPDRLKKNLKKAIEMEFNAKRDSTLAKKRREVDREIEDLEMRLDF